MNGIANMLQLGYMRGGRNKITFSGKEKLKELYLDSGLSSIEIGRMFGVGKHVVLSRLREFGIKRRNNSEARIGKFDGENSPSFRGAIYQTPSGYSVKKLLLSERGNHRADAFHRAYVHTYNMEKHIGRKLRDEEVVHHIDRNRKNNELSNLIVFPSQGEHIRFHKYVEDLGLYSLTLLKDKPNYKLPAGAVIPKSNPIKVNENVL